MLRRKRARIAIAALCILLLLPVALFCVNGLLLGFGETPVGGTT